MNLGLFVALFAALLVCLEGGRRSGRKGFGRTDRPHPTGLGTVEAVTFGLLGLLLAFTFSGAAARLDARRGQIVDEANALGTAWLRLDVLPGNAQPKLRDAFRKYTDSRIAVSRTFSHSGVDAARKESARSTALQQEIWTQAVDACREVPSATVVVLPALNAMFDIATTRLAATEMHPPGIVYVVLALVLSFTFDVILDFEYPSGTPTIVALKQAGPWTVGALWNQVWSFSGNAERQDVNQMFIQPFLAYTTRTALTVTAQSESVGDFKADTGKWTIPINLLVSKVSSFGMFPASYQVGFGGYPVHPDVGPSWKVRGAIVLPLPRRQ